MDGLVINMIKYQTVNTEILKTFIDFTINYLRREGVDLNDV